MRGALALALALSSLMLAACQPHAAHCGVGGSSPELVLQPQVPDAQG